jgi:hypothetical protein
LKIGNYTTHPAADIFPLMDDGTFALLVADIEKHGLTEPCIAVDVDGETLVLDGRNRLRACLQLGGQGRFEPRWRKYTGPDPVAYVVSTNLHRRHLTESQRALAAARIEEIYACEAKKRQAATQHRGPVRASLPTPEEPRPPTARARDEAAKTVNVSSRSVGYAKVVVECGVPELVAAVQDGRLAVSVAAAAARELCSQEQTRILQASGGAKTTLRAAIREAMHQDAPAAPVKLLVPDDLVERLQSLVPDRAASVAEALRLVVDRGLDALGRGVDA